MSSPLKEKQLETTERFIAHIKKQREEKKKNPYEVEHITDAKKDKK